MSDVVMRTNDLRPYLDCVLKDANGARDLTGETVRFVMRSSGNTVIVDQTSTGSNVIVTDTTGGGVRYKWQSTDVDTPGNFNGEWEATSALGEPMTFPNNGFISIVFTPEPST